MGPASIASIAKSRLFSLAPRTVAVGWPLSLVTQVGHQLSAPAFLRAGLLRWNTRGSFPLHLLCSLSSCLQPYLPYTPAPLMSTLLLCQYLPPAEWLPSLLSPSNDGRPHLTLGYFFFVLTFLLLLPEPCSPNGMYLGLGSMSYVSVPSLQCLAGYTETIFPCF